jgi:phosphomannomutase
MAFVALIVNGKSGKWEMGKTVKCYGKRFVSNLDYSQKVPLIKLVFDFMNTAAAIFMNSPGR